METAIAFGFIVVVMVFAVIYAVELGRARGVGRMFEKRRTREPDKTDATETPSAPFAKGDAIRAVQLQVHERPDTPREVAESFLAHLTRGYGVPGLSIIGADPMAYEKAWSLLGPNRPPLAEFTKRWGGTVALKVVQLEPAKGGQFFVELQALERCGEHWSLSFHSGFLKTVLTEAGWRVQALETSPEDLLGINVAGHQGWQHDETLMAKWVLPGPPDDSWRVADVQYAGRQAVVRLSHPVSGQTRTVRLIRTMEGSWGLLSISGDPQEASCR